MIVKNEEDVLARCLNSIKDAVDEIIIIDTGSTDRTKEIASKYTNLVFDFEWIDDFSAARNEAYSKATKDYQMWLDADDVLPEKEKEKLLLLKAALDPKTDIVTMKYHTCLDDEGKPVFTSTRERLTRRERGFCWNDPVHEFIAISGNIVHSDIAIHHLKEKAGKISERNLKIYEALELSSKPFTPRQQYYFARELKDHGQFIKSAYYFERFLSGRLGWVEDNIAACLSLGGCYKQLGEYTKILPALLKSFEYDSPRAEICCEIGYYHKQMRDFSVALKWFRLATLLERPDSIGFILQDYYDYIPLLESCVCCYELGDLAQAKKFNELAAKIKPNSAAVAHNRAIFGSALDFSDR